MKFAALANSPRLKRVDMLLSTGLEYSTLDIINKARVCAVNSAVAELRENGRVISCRREGDTWYYRMEVANASSR